MSDLRAVVAEPAGGDERKRPEAGGKVYVGRMRAEASGSLPAGAGDVMSLADGGMKPPLRQKFSN